LGCRVGQTVPMRWFAPLAALPSGLARDVLIESRDGVFSKVLPDSLAGVGAPVPGPVSPGGDLPGVVLPGIVLPGFANGHSHAFHRALRGRTHDRGGTFWTWRERMYALAARLDPDSYFALARAVYAEMALAGITSVGEFHYLHHAPGGRRYADPNAMAIALAAAAAEAGVRLTLLDTCYLAGGISGEPLAPEQLRFGDGDVASWAARVAAMCDSPTLRIGVAVHSVRAVPRAALGVVAAVADGRPLHVHLSEQPAENDACRAAHGCTPTRLLSDEGVLGPATTAVHATHLEPADIELLARSATTVCVCPTTEHDLADGIAPAGALAAAGVPLSLGSDQNAVIDLLAEAQALEFDQRAISLHRGRFRPSELLDALTAHASIGWHDAGRLEVGARADLVAVRLDTVRTAGLDAAQVVLVAGRADIDTVVVDGSVVVRDGQHRLGEVGALLRDAIEPLWRSA
jgi:formiminoglutamate deiminase